MTKERFQEIKENWLEVNEGAFMSPLLKKSLKDIPWLISEVERLQAVNESKEKVIGRQFFSMVDLQQKAERLEKALKDEKQNQLEILEHALSHPTSRYTVVIESEIIVDWHKSLTEEIALETEGKE